MKSEIETKKCQVNGVEVKGDGYSEIAINYFTELVRQNKKFSSKDRMRKYMEYFVKTFKLEQNDNKEETFVTNNQKFFKLIKENVGDAKQMSKALVLLGTIDRKYVSKNYLDVLFADFKVIKNNKKMDHDIAMFTDPKGNCFIIDFSLIMQADEGSRNKLFLIPLENYFIILMQNGYQLTDEQNIIVNWYMSPLNQADICYKNLMLSSKEIDSNPKFKEFFKRTFDLSEFLQKIL